MRLPPCHLYCISPTVLTDPTTCKATRHPVHHQLSRPSRHDDRLQIDLSKVVAMFNSSVRRAARSTPAIPTNHPIRCSSRVHQRRHSSSKPPVPPNNGSPTIPAAVKQVTAKSGTKNTKATRDVDGESEKPSSKAASKKAAQSEVNWTSSLPSVPGLHHMSPPGMSSGIAERSPIS
jgi:hypothetical protein